MMATTSEAILSLRPAAEWTLVGDDVSAIEWITEGVEPVTAAQVAQEVQRLEAEKAAARESALAKLAALGLTVDDLTALGL